MRELFATSNPESRFLPHRVAFKLSTEFANDTENLRGYFSFVIGSDTIQCEMDGMLDIVPDGEDAGTVVMKPQSHCEFPRPDLPARIICRRMITTRLLGLMLPLIPNMKRDIEAFNALRAPEEIWTFDDKIDIAASLTIPIAGTDQMLNLHIHGRTPETDGRLPFQHKIRGGAGGYLVCFNLGWSYATSESIASEARVEMCQFLASVEERVTKRFASKRAIEKIATDAALSIRSAG